MNDLSPNDLSPVIAADKAHVWHHLSPVSYTHLTLPTKA